MAAQTALLAEAALFKLDPREIETGNRIGFLHSDKAAALGRLMAVDGQRDPIKVVKNRDSAERPWRLVTGMHRTHGADLEGIKVWAIEVSGKPEDLADLEASENLHRRPLAPIERAKFVHALANAAQERIAREHGGLKQQQLAIKARWARVKSGEIRAEQALRDESDDTADKMSTVYGWHESAADAMGLDKRTIRRALELYRLIVEPFPDLALALSQHPIVGENASQLKAIADIQDQGLRRRVIEALLADDGLNVDDARIGVGISSPSGPPPAPHEKHVSAVVGNLGRLSASLQKRHLQEFVVALKTDDVKRQLRDMLNAELGE